MAEDPNVATPKASPPKLLPHDSAEADAAEARGDGQRDRRGRHGEQRVGRVARVLRVGDVHDRAVVEEENEEERNLARGCQRVRESVVVGLGGGMNDERNHGDENSRPTPKIHIVNGGKRSG